MPRVGYAGLLSMGKIRNIKDWVQSISTKMAIAFFIASAVPLVIGYVLIGNNTHAQIQANTERQLVEMATSRERLLREHIESMQNHAEALALLPSLGTFLTAINQNGQVQDEDQIKAARDLNAIQSSTWGLSHHIFVVNTEGLVVLSPPKTGWDQPALTAGQIRSTQSPHFNDSITDADNFSAGLVGPAVSGFFGFSERDHFHQLAMHPIRNANGRVIGMVVIEIQIETTQQLLLDNFMLGKTGRLFLTTDTGELVVHLKDDLTNDFHSGSGLFVAIKNEQIATGIFQLNDKEVHGVYLPSDIYPWVLCIEIDHDEVMEPVLAQQQGFAVVGAIILMLCGLTAILVARIFGDPIKSLVKSANAVAAGDLHREIEVTSNNEIGQLQSSVNDMRFSLKQHIDKLDFEVEIRTALLTELNEQLMYDTDHDKLTGLANRHLFCQRLNQELERYKENEVNLVSVLFFDFDRFKLVNDSLGHAAGDALLCSIADRFRENLRKTDLSARFGGDEFVVMLSPVQSLDHALEGANRLLKLFEKRHLLDGNEITSTASIGLVTADPRYTTADEMIRDADAAMYQAKLDGKDRVVTFDQKMLEDAKFRLKIQEDLNRVIEKQQLRLAYQPIVNLETMLVEGFEALIRWDHPELGWVRPDQFVEIAEDTGKIIEIGEWIIERAIHDLQTWNNDLPQERQLSVNVNVSKRQLMYAGFMPHLKGVLGSTAINPANLKVEVTESTIVDPRSGMGDVINEISSLGVKIAMDDFGTGHSSLSLLHKFKFDVLKIDQSFIQGMDLSHDIGAVLHATIELAKNTGMQIVAEGVESESQVTTLIAHGCDMVQGYFFAKPLFYDDVIEFLANNNETRHAA